MDKIFTENLRFVDEYGRERIFTGMNVCDKKDFIKDNCGYGFSPDEFPFKEFKARGFDMIRLGFTWAAMEPMPEQYNDKLISDLGKFLDKCEEYGIYAYLDCHQDCWGPSCYGDGAPAWATVLDGKMPTKPVAVWAEPYFYGVACHRAFDNFWNNRVYKKKGLQEHFANMWSNLITKLGNKPPLFGYDFLNEPFPGSDGGKIFRRIVAGVAKTTITDKRISLKEIAKQAVGTEKPRVLDQYSGDIFNEITENCNEIGWKFDETKYSPFISRMTTAVRKITDKGIVFVDNNYFSNLGIPCGNKAAENDGEREPLQCFSPHGYDLMVDTPAYKYASNSRVGMIFDQHRKTQLRLGVPCLVGEWGARSEGTDWYPHMRFVMEKFDSYKWSNTYWCYTNGIMDEDFADLLTRPRPKAVAGEIIDYSYDFENGVFTLNYKQDKEYSKPTVIYIDRMFRNIECDGEYTVNSIDGGNGAEIEITTGVGEHCVRVEF